jgi:hypothetical protein
MQKNGMLKVKGKDEVVPVLNYAPRHEGVLGSGGIAPRIFRPRHWMEVSGQLHAPAALPPTERAPGTHWIESWVGARAVLDAVVKI